MELCGASGCLNRQFPRTGWVCVWGGEILIRQCFRGKTQGPSRVQPCPPFPGTHPPFLIRLKVPASIVCPSANKCQTSAGERCVWFFFFFRFSFLCFPIHPPSSSSSPSYPSLFLAPYFPLSLSLLPSSLLPSFLSFFLRKRQECAHTTRSSPMGKPI